MLVDSVIGDIDDDRFAGRRRHYVDVGWADATKHRQVVVADSGEQVRIMLPRGTFLYDGAVLADDGETVVVVRRPEEDALTVRFDDNCGVDGARRMLLLGYLLGNQHAPIDVGDDRVAAPLFTSAQAARQMLAELQIDGDVRPVAMARHGWARTSADAHAGHHH
ncbi:urease accessory protein UreE [Mycolicibacterium phlei]